MNKLGSLVDTFFALIGLIILCIFLTIFTPHFLTIDNILNVGRQVSVTAIVAVGMTIVIVTAGIDLSVGSVVAFSGCVAALGMVELPVFLNELLGINISPTLAIVIGITFGVLAGGLCGATNGVITSYLNITPFIATLGMMSIARGAALVITDGTPIDKLPEGVLYFGSGQILGIPVPIIIMILVALIGGLILRKTRLGRYAFAMGSNEEAVRLSGVNLKGYKTMIYVINGLLAGLAGIILMARVSSAQPMAGGLMELDAIAAVVIGGASLMGGRGTIFGTIVGAAIMGVLRNGLVLLDVSAFWQQLVIGCVIILAVTVDQVRHNKRD